jgi:hypothetical protein
MLMAAGYFLPKLTGCSPAYSIFKTDIIDKKVSVPLNMFDQNPLQFVRPKGWYFDIAVQKNADNTYQALLLQCTHQENQLTPVGKKRIPLQPAWQRIRFQRKCKKRTSRKTT